jgi:hypothetical protein
MGRMKKLYELSELIDRRTCTYGDLDQAAEVMRMAHAEVNQVLDLVRKSEFLLNDWLATSTEHLFEEQPDIDAARNYLLEAIELLEESTNGNTKGRGAEAAHAG